ncbi:MAG TPA: hypothetical protein VLA66_02075, partial [Thermoanaerobaculia bacterium]|nr:hypothetical protein [Thermoanaerobaculia bacterium]
GALLAIERRIGPERLYGRLPRPLRIAVVFVLVLFSRVLFRAPDLRGALAYFGRMFALVPVAESAPLLAGLTHGPYLLITFAAAAIVVWAAPQTWTWTRTLSPVRVATAFALFAGSVALLATQDFNPFIYFIF